MMSAEQAREAVPLVRKAWEDAGREKPVISLMTHGIIGSDPVDLPGAGAQGRGDQRRRRLRSEAYIKGLRENSLVGTVAEIGEQLSELEAVGVERVMLQHLTHNDLDGVDLIAELADS